MPPSTPRNLPGSVDPLLDPIAAYDRLAPEYRRVSERRQPYLNSIDRLVISNVPPGSTSLLDIGSGDGRRASRIASAADIIRVTLLEPSPAMRLYWPSDVEAWDIKAEQLSRKDGSFDVITCLWNVLGHVFPADNRVEVLRQIGRLLAPHGLAFVDVNHRYNMRHYGLFRTLVRKVHDVVRHDSRNGDVTVAWNIGAVTCETKGHVFTHSEFCHLALNAGLKLRRVFSIDYDNGMVRLSRLSGNLLYVLSRSTPD